MASDAASTTLAHRSVASIRGGAPQGPGPSAPHTPNRSSVAPVPSYGSPSTIRADDEVIVVEIGSRHVRVGFAGDTSPKASLQCSPEDQRRAGDFRGWQQSKPAAGLHWSKEHEFWRYDLREIELGAFQDKLERILHDAFSRYLLIDSRPRRIGLVLDSGVPIPLLTATLDIMFNRFQSPTVSLMSTPTMSAISAGVRSALVIDMGWAETVVTSIYEYREVKTTRTVRGGKALLDSLYTTIEGLIPGDHDATKIKAIGFKECEDIMCRLMWCKPSEFRSAQRQSTQLETVDEQEEIEAESAQSGLPTGVAQIPINTASRPLTVDLSFEKLSDICDDTFFDPSADRATFDDDELPLHLLLYKHLLQLPLDVRAICMSRIMFTGGCSDILGIKQRIIDDLTAIVKKRGWEPVFGKVVDKHRSTTRLHRQSSTTSPTEGSPPSSKNEDEHVPSPKGAADKKHEPDPIEAKVERQRETVPQMKGQIRVLKTLGPWIGGSLLCQLKVPAMAVIDREAWLQHGANGASRPSEVDYKVQQRQSMQAGGYGRGGHHGNWTLGVWGSI